MKEAMEVIAETRKSTRLLTFVQSGIDSELCVALRFLFFIISHSWRSLDRLASRVATRTQPAWKYLLSQLFATGNGFSHGLIRIMVLKEFCRSTFTRSRNSGTPSKSPNQRSPIRTSRPARRRLRPTSSSLAMQIFRSTAWAGDWSPEGKSRGQRSVRAKRSSLLIRDLHPFI